MSKPVIARRCFISGRVQGVYFRGSTRDQARLLDLRGHARNLEDGRVEVLAVGAVTAVQQLVAWLHKGPPSARVDAVESADVTPVPVVDDFSVL